MLTSICLMIINCTFGVQACFGYNIKVTKLGMYDMKSLKFATVLFTLVALTNEPQ